MFQTTNQLMFMFILWYELSHLLAGIHPQVVYIARPGVRPKKPTSELDGAPELIVSDAARFTVETK